MKKLMMFLSLCGLVVCMVGCADIDYGCTWSYNIVNQTESDIIFTVNEMARMRITPGEKKTVYTWFTECGQNNTPGDMYTAEQLMPLSHSSQQTVRLQMNDEYLPDIILKRKYWDFVNEVYNATYILIVTDGLLGAIRLENN